MQPQQKKDFRMRREQFTALPIFFRPQKHVADVRHARLPGQSQHGFPIVRELRRIQMRVRIHAAQRHAQRQRRCFGRRFFFGHDVFILN